MLLLNDFDEIHSPQTKIRTKPSHSSHLTSLKIAYRSNRQRKLLSIFENMLNANESIHISPPKQERKYESNNKERSSYQLYKQKQRQLKQKLHEGNVLQNKGPIDNSFHCTLRIREGRPPRKISRTISEGFHINAINSTRSQFHTKDEIKKQSFKISRGSTTQCISRKEAIPRRNSFDCTLGISKKIPVSQKCTRVEFKKKIFNPACRPWSPAYEQQLMFFPAGEQQEF